MKTDDPRLTAFALGELSDTERAELDAELASSPAAQQEVEETRELAAILAQGLAREAAAPIDPNIPLAVERHLAGDSAATADNVIEIPRARFAWVWSAAAAVALMLGLAAVWSFLPERGASAKGRLAQNSNPTSASSSGSALGEGAPLPSGPSPAQQVAPAPVDTADVPSSTASSEAMASAPSKVPDVSNVPATPAAPIAIPEPGAGPRVDTLADSTAPQESRRGSEMSPALMNRYGLVASDPPRDANADAYGPETRLPVATPNLSARAAPAGPGMASAGGAVLKESARLRTRLGRESESRAPWARELAEAESVDVDRSALVPFRGGAGAVRAPSGEMSPQLRSRYALGPAPVSGTEPAPEFLIRRESRPGRVVRPPEEPEANPGYLNVGINAFQSVMQEPLSTFSLDVDTGSYANLRRFLMAGSLPPSTAVRVEEMINYFPYHYAAPRGDEIFAAQVDVASCPWQPSHRLVRIAIKAREQTTPRPAGNLVFLVDVSGSMTPAERLPLLKQALRALVKRLSPADRVAIVTYASSAGVRLASTSCEEKDRILAAIDSLEPGGSTNGEGGIREAYDVAVRDFIPGGVNRVLLCTDGDFNVGMRNQDELVQLIQEKARSGVFLTALGVGTDNFKDALMRRLADQGNGTYHYLDSFEEAQRVLLEQMDATFVTVAKDAKAQIEFNPARANAWRLIGYEKRLMAHQDFQDDTKDAGEIGAGHQVTVLYEVVPEGTAVPGEVGPLKYQSRRSVEAASGGRKLVPSPELLTVKLRYQKPEGSPSMLIEIPVVDDGRDFTRASADFRFAAAVAAFGMSLRQSTTDQPRMLGLSLDLARQSLGDDPGGWRAEMVTLVNKARSLIGRRQGVTPNIE